MQAYYWLTRCTGLPWYTLNGVTSGLTPYLFNRVALWSTHYRVTLYGVLSLVTLWLAYSGLTSGLTLFSLSGLPYAVSSGLSSPRSLSLSLSSLPSLCTAVTDTPIGIRCNAG